MEILLLIAIVAVGASGLYVAATFNTRTRQNFTPLMNNTERNLGKEITAARGVLEQEMQAITGEVRRNSDQTRRLEAASGELRQQAQAQADELRNGRELLNRLEAATGELRQQMQVITDELRRNSELVKHFGEQTGGRQNQLGEDLMKLGHQVGAFGDALADQGNRISGMYRHVISQELSAGSSTEDNSLLLAMLEAESYVDDKGWGGRPHLFALTEKASRGAAGGQSATGISGARPAALVLVDRGRLPEGNLVTVLADIRWPEDVVGCVLVTELAALPRGSEEEAPIDPDAAGQWTSTHPDGRTARLAVGIRASGEHKSGLRIKGEDEMHIRTDVAPDVVAALQHTF